MKKTDGKFDLDRESIEAVIFDMNPVVVKTHAAAWKKLLDAFLRDLSEKKENDFRPFGIENDYRLYVDAKSRYKGAESYLESRDLKLQQRGDPDDPPERK